MWCDRSSLQKKSGRENGRPFASPGEAGSSWSHRFVRNGGTPVLLSKPTADYFSLSECYGGNLRDTSLAAMESAILWRSASRGGALPLFAMTNHPNSSANLRRQRQIARPPVKWSQGDKLRNAAGTRQTHPSDSLSQRSSNIILARTARFYKKTKWRAGLRAGRLSCAKEESTVALS